MTTSQQLREFWLALRQPRTLWPRHPAAPTPNADAATSADAAAYPRALAPMPTPALRWMAAGRVALRVFDWNADSASVCAFQAETYEFNFPGFRYTSEFGSAFRYDLRRASLDPQHGLFVLDARRPPAEGSSGVSGFLWLVACQNTWTGDRYGYINNLYIAPDSRGQGLGRELMTQSEAFFRSRGIHRVRLTVSAHNAAAVHLYETCGYNTTRWEMEKDV